MEMEQRIRGREAAITEQLIEIVESAIQSEVGEIEAAVAIDTGIEAGIEKEEDTRRELEKRSGVEIITKIEVEIGVERGVEIGVEIGVERESITDTGKGDLVDLSIIVGVRSKMSSTRDIIMAAYQT